MPEAATPGGTWLGFDFGIRRIGVAVGQTTTRTAGGLATVSHGREPDWQAIARLVEEWRPAGLVVGLPLNREGGETDMSRAARRFGSALGKRFGLPVAYMDERLTSSQAERAFAEARTEGRARRKDVRKLDAQAAKIILENWLQSLPPPDHGPAQGDQPR